jgi:nitrogen regulatory protein PII
MHFKLIIALLEDSKTEGVMDAARQAGAKGVTVLNQARGEGCDAPTTFLGLHLEAQRDVVLFLVEAHLAREIIEDIASAANFESEPGAGIAFTIDVEDAIGVNHQIQDLVAIVEDKL